MSDILSVRVIHSTLDLLYALVSDVIRLYILPEKFFRVPDILTVLVILYIFSE